MSVRRHQGLLNAVLAFLMVCAAILLAGCGVKADPEPPESVRPVSPHALTITAVAGNRIRLHWQLKQPDGIHGLPAVCVVSQAAVRLKDGCSTCPLTFEAIHRMPVHRLQADGYRFEIAVPTGFMYTYRIHSESLAGIRGKKTASGQIQMAAADD
ncbi:MAG: hypothetical protein CSA22_04670 [Deltaproteobacteria bacterium]|nr:MAG: hypothetical protein CSA22_04670 [Deltaproteobacteria bacterium]